MPQLDGSAIDSTTVFDRIRITCHCASHKLHTVLVYNGDTIAGYLNGAGGNWDPADPEIIEVISRINAGTCAVYYQDRSTIWLQSDMPRQYLLMLTRHPFHKDEDSGYKTPGQLILHSAYEESSITARPGITIAGDMRAKKVAPRSGNMPRNLDEWSVQPLSSTTFGLRLTVDSEDAVTNATFDDHIPAIAFVNWLNSIRTAGGAIPSAGLLNYQNFGIPRKYTFVLSDTNSVVAICDGAAPGIINGLIVNADYTFTVESGTFDADLLSALIAGVEASIPVVAGQTEDPEFGAYDIPTRGSSFETADGQGITQINRLWEARWKDLGSETILRLPLFGSYGRVVNWNDLTLQSGTTRLMPRPHQFPACDVIHFDGTSAGTLRLLTPAQMVGIYSMHRPLRVHNRSATVVLTLEDWDGTDFFFLQPGEEIDFSFTYHNIGGGEMIATNVPKRRLIDSHGDLGVLSGPGHWNYTDADWLRPLPVSATPTYIDNDAFLIGSAAVSGGAVFANVSDLHVPASIKVMIDGDLTYRGRWGIRVEGSGNLPSGHQTLLFHRKDSDASREIHDDPSYPVLTTTGETRTYGLEARFPVKKNDIVLPAMTMAKSASLNAGHIDCYSLIRSATLEPTIRKEYVAS